ncbi:MAG: biotin--[acetyl-CoA-carboxylase] ligase [Chitinophagaceae bacterium]|nr:biotin--[acetyl-CoA-carboxylase] ligase [Chitinophagaceae bacterium]
MPVGKPFIQLFEVDSTNNYAMAQVQASLAVHGTAWFAHQQTSGKGQRGKAWLSNEKENIILSFAIDPSPLFIRDQFVISAITALACVDLFKRYNINDVKIKWPNDVFCGDRKAGGILIENVIQGQNWKFSIVGIGININQTNFATDIVNATSLAVLTGEQYDPVLLAQELCSIFEKRWSTIISGNFQDIMKEYHDNLYKLDEVVSFKYENAVFSATVLGVNFRGELRLDTGEEITLPSGRVTWLSTN